LLNLANAVNPFYRYACISGFAGRGGLYWRKPNVVENNKVTVARSLAMAIQQPAGGDSIAPGQKPAKLLANEAFERYSRIKIIDREGFFLLQTMQQTSFRCIALRGKYGG
jgi:hypothetical protein